MTAARLREAHSRDVAAMHRVRLAVRENRLVSRITEADYLAEIEVTGRGWVVEREGAIVGFAVANVRTGNIWALFVHPSHERQGHGRALHETLLRWLFSKGVERAWLTTQAGTRAERFYLAAGWRCAATTPDGELVLEMYSRDAPFALS